MKTRFTMSAIAQFLLAVAPNGRGRLFPCSIISGFSPSAPYRSVRRTGMSTVGQFSYRTITTTCRRTSLSEHQGDSLDCDSRSEEKKHNWLVVGDGDFSYCASIAERLAEKDIQLYATVLEEEKHHNAVYKRSVQNKDSILSYPRTESSTTESKSQHKVKFGIDATRLIEFFPSTEFQTIEFNFPHWGGKTNAKRNRQLLDNFMASACEVLSKEGEIVISLCEGQGGFPASNVEEWKQSWLVPEYAAKHGLVLRDLSPYEPLYQQTSHRGKDRPWIKDGTDQRYTFTFPNEECIDDDLQISCRHELRIVLPADFEANSEVSRNEIIDGDAVFQLTKRFVPEGIRMEVVAREILKPYYFNDEEVTLAIFLLNYSGERMPLTRETADSIRSKLEASVDEHWGFDIAKGGRLVSRPYPTQLLPSLIKESYERQATSSISKR